MPRRILVVADGTAPIDLVEKAADSEHELQTVLLQNPQLIPADDLGFDEGLLVVGRETTLASGSVDLLCLSRGGEIVIIGFKTGPQNPDFRHALAQVIDYGSDLWKLAGWHDFDEGVVRRYLAGSHALPEHRGASDLKDVAVRMWRLSDNEWEAMAQRLDEVLGTGDFVFVVAAQRFTDSMKDSVRYLNEVTRYGRYFLIELIRLDGSKQKAYAAQVVQVPSTRSKAGVGEKATESDFLAGFDDPDYSAAIGELFSTVSSLGFVLAWYSKGASIRVKSPDSKEPLSIGWVFHEGAGYLSARHVTFGVDPASLSSRPKLTTAVTNFCDQLSELPEGRSAGGSLDAVVFEPAAFCTAKDALIGLLTNLSKAATVVDSSS